MNNFQGLAGGCCRNHDALARARGYSGQKNLTIGWRLDRVWRCLVPNDVRSCLFSRRFIGRDWAEDLGDTFGQSEAFIGLGGLDPM